MAMTRRATAAGSGHKTVVELASQSGKCFYSESFQHSTPLKNLTVQDLLSMFVETILSTGKYSTGSHSNFIDETVPVSDLAVVNGSRHLRVILDISTIKQTDSRIKDPSLVRKWFSIVKKSGGYKIPILIPFILACIWIGTYKPKEGDEVCFANVDCFSLDYPWSERSLMFNFVPQSPAAISTQITLFSREDKSVVFSARRINPLIKDFKWDKKLFIIIHGYMDDGTTWMTNMTDAFLFKNDANVLSVDWNMGARMYYPQVVANTRVVAAEIALLLFHLQTHANLKFESVHIIGHSLGSHIASYVGKRVQNLGKITALDPAFPLFEGHHEDVGLHRTDADEVEVIHSNVGPFGFGIRNPVGSVDIYLNNAQDQPGCTQMSELISGPLTVERISGMQDEIACSHRRAYEVFTASLTANCLLIAYDCEYSELFSNSRQSCRIFKDKSYILNHSSSKTGLNRTLFLNTLAKPPFCDMMKNIQ